jgi:hypothetical protein|tara:strand:+ start:357 stop:545 length:189 start_codon:yes stop_codon:yes gene_type:complete
MKKLLKLPIISNPTYSTPIVLGLFTSSIFFDLSSNIVLGLIFLVGFLTILSGISYYNQRKKL